MTDIAQLGLAIESKNTVDAVRALDQMVPASARAEQAYGKIERAANLASQRQKEYEQSITRATQAQEKFTRAQTAMVNSAANINQRLDVRDSFGGQARAADIAAYGAELDKLRARFNPLFAVQQTYEAEVSEINRALKVGAISEQERSNALARSKVSYDAQVKSINAAQTATNGFTSSVGLARHELINLSRQGQDVAVSLASGQSPFLVLIQQGTQIADVFASSNATVGSFFKQAWDWTKSIVTPARLAAGALLAMGIAAATAANQWGAAQRQIDMQLLGAGRASGASRGDINTIAASQASAFGLSVAEARELAGTLAATGQIGRESLTPIVALGKDIARAYGIEASEAAQLLAKSFADPVRGAAALNERLGFMDAALQRNIRDLVDQNRVFDAQRLLIDGVRSGLDGVSSSVGSSAKFWTALGNAISNAWDRFGEFAAEVTGIGWAPALEEKIKAVRDRIAELEEIAGRRSDVVNRTLGTTATLERERAELDQLTEAWQKYQRATEDAQARRDSHRVAAAIRQALPEIDAKQMLQNTLETIKNTDGVLMRILGVTPEQQDLARRRTEAALIPFRAQIERAA